MSWDTTLSITSENGVQNKVVTKAVRGKQKNITFDNTPTADSNNLIRSSKLYELINSKTEELNTNKPDFIETLQNKGVRISTDANWSDIKEGIDSLDTYNERLYFYIFSITSLETPTVSSPRVTSGIEVSESSDLDGYFQNLGFTVSSETTSASSKEIFYRYGDEGYGLRVQLSFSDDTFTSLSGYEINPTFNDSIISHNSIMDYATFHSSLIFFKTDDDDGYWYLFRTGNSNGIAYINGYFVDDNRDTVNVMVSTTYGNMPEIYILSSSPVRPITVVRSYSPESYNMLITSKIFFNYNNKLYKMNKRLRIVEGPCSSDSDISYHSIVNFNNSDAIALCGVNETGCVWVGGGDIFVDSN